MLSLLDERGIYGRDYYLKRAINDIVVLENGKGEEKHCVDLISAYGACNFGHCNPKIRPFVEYQADLVAGFYPYQAEVYSKWLIGKLELSDYQLLFQVGGSSAVSTSISIANKNRKGKIAYLSGSFHGLDSIALNCTSVQRSMAIQDCEISQLNISHFIEIIPDSSSFYKIDWTKISCFIFEPIQGANGYIPINKTWLNELINYIKKFGVIVIADEIQCGFYRHGSLSISRKEKFNFDIILFSKSLTNGLFPFSAIVYKNEFCSNLPENVYLAPTFQTSALGCYAAHSVSEYIESTNIEHYCTMIEKEFFNFKEFLDKKKLSIGNIYVTGPTISFELLNSSTKEFVQKCFKKKILVFTGGQNSNRIRIAPPITIPIKTLKGCIKSIMKIVENL